MLKLKLWRVENVVFMKVLEQDEELRENLDFVAKNGVRIISRAVPGIYNDNEVYVKGWDGKYDDRIVLNDYTSVDDAKDKIKLICDAVKEFNQQYKPSTDNEPDNIEVVIAE